MNWRIEEKEAFEVFGIERIFGNDETGLVPGLWDECTQNGTGEKLVAASGEEPPTSGALPVKGICGYSDDVDCANQFAYMLGVYKTEKSNSAGYTTAVIPKSTWAIFRTEKIEGFGAAIPTLFNRAYSEWLPSSGYDKANTADLEVYGIDEDGGKYEEVWIPVKKI
jgi:AraC family transcriptional regulator